MMIGATRRDDAARFAGPPFCAGVLAFGFIALVPIPASAQASSATLVPQAGTPAPLLNLKRDTLTTGTATGTPAGGTFSYSSQVQSGSTIGKLTSADQTSNPNMMSMADPANPSGTGSPSPGGLGNYTATYTVNGMAVRAKNDDPFPIPTFGMSCYYTALESDWGSAADNMCKTLKLNGKVHAGTVKNPHGYPGTYCRSFIAEVVLQGSAQTNAGNYIQYNAGKITQVDAIKGADGTAVVAGQTVARDRAIVHGHSSIHVDADGVGMGLLANDTGGAIRGYRLDFYQGSGAGVCAGYTNPMTISACTPKEATCPGFARP